MDVKDALNARRAYRAFDPVEISDNIIKELADAASLAPSCFNNQPAKLIFVKNKEQLEKTMTALNKGNEWAYKDSMIIAVLAKKDFDCVIKDRLYYLFDTGIAVGNLLLRAVELGLAAHPIAGYSPEKTKEALSIPDEFEVVTLINVGKKGNDMSALSDWQKEQENNRPARLPAENRYSIDRYDEKLNVRPAR
ncbi:MAG TPA: nitroreductase family protein [Candidatus Goldiibacteriota bacterium]|nr:nitroreductase family protein [Candidatus Goldiibacteriota bacterium]